MLMVAHKTGGRIRWADDAGTVPNIMSMMPPRERQHPNEKPLELMLKIVGIHSKPGDTVLDPFMGSGTTGAACAMMGRSFVGIELDVAHFETACRRIEEAYRQPRLFAEPKPAPVQEALALTNGAAANPAKVRHLKSPSERVATSKPIAEAAE